MTNTLNPQPELGYRDISERTGLTVGTLRWRKKFGSMPDPDGYDRRGPFWYEATITGWDIGTIRSDNGTTRGPRKTVNA